VLPMTPSIDQPINEHLAWVQWWAFPLKYAHEDWRDDAFSAMDAFARSGGLLPCPPPGVATCLPPAPHATVLRLALASMEQLDLALTLIHDTFSPQASSTLSESHQLWCTRLSKALPPALLLPDADPLQLLHSWVEPSIWQRLRLRFPRERVRESEKKPPIKSASSPLNTLWQAVVWRVTTTASDTMPPGSDG
jgi:hypothetical protein